MSVTAAAAYPEEFEADVELSDGGTAFFRPVRPDDGPAFVEFHERQSAESIYYRFFSPHPRLSEAEVERFVNVDHHDRFALVAFLGDELIGVARYDRPPASRTAEVAFFIDDDHHGRGLATLLLEHLAEAARSRGIDGFWATVLPDNRRMVGVFRQAGFGVTSRFSDGVIEVELVLDPTEEARAAIEERARRAQQQAVRRLLEPRHVAVVGASTSHDGLGRRALDSILDHGYTGRVSVVHPDAKTVSGVACHRSVLEIPGDEPVDLALVAVPAPAALEVVDECGRAGVAAVVVISAGFADAGEQGRALELQLLSLVRRHGMRLLGPNCLGLINTDPEISLHATFVPSETTTGRVAIMSQSGLMGGAILEHATQVGLGVSSFVSVGNKADVSGNDLLTFWGDDPRTSVVLLYLESFGNPRRFARIAREVTASTPVLAIKAGRRRRSPDSGLDDGTVDTLLAGNGVIRVDGIARLLDVARVLSFQGAPEGNGVALVGNSGGALRLAADAASAEGLVVVAEHDLGWDASIDDFGHRLQISLASADVDLAIVVYAPPDRRGPSALFGELHRIAMGFPAKPIIGSVFGPHEPVATGPHGRSIPVFDFPDDAAVAAAHAARWGSWRAREAGEELDVELDAVRIGRLVEAALGDDDRAALGLAAGAEVLRAAGLDVVDFEIVGSAEEAVEASTRLGPPVALKAGGLDGPARREAEGASLDLFEPGDVAAAFARMTERFGSAMAQAVVQRMVEPGADLAVGVEIDPEAGPVLWARRGGTGASGEARRTLLPLTDREAGRLLGDDVEGADRRAAVDLLARLAALAEHVRSVDRIRLDPVVVIDGTAWITNVAFDARHRHPHDEPPDVRRL